MQAWADMIPKASPYGYNRNSYIVQVRG